MHSPTCTSRCKAVAPFGSEAAAAAVCSAGVWEGFAKPGGLGGGRSRTFPTASSAMCFPGGPQPTRQDFQRVWSTSTSTLKEKSGGSQQLESTYACSECTWKVLSQKSGLNVKQNLKHPRRPTQQIIAGTQGLWSCFLSLLVHSAEP